MRTDLGRGLPVEVNGRRYLLIEVPADGDDGAAARPHERTVRLLVERVQTLAHDLGRVERERDELAAEIDRLRAPVAPAASTPAERALVRRRVEDSWAAPGHLRARRGSSSVPARRRWPGWRH
jgi:hypothetical protein